MISSQASTEPVSDLKFDPKSAIYVPLGAASPFWLLYAGAATAGVAYWWLSRWREATNLEALFAKTSADLDLASAPAVASEAEAPAVEPEPESAFVAAAELLVEASPVIEAVAEPEPEIEATPEPAAPKPKTARAARALTDDLA